MLSFSTQPITCPACHRAVVRGLEGTAPLCEYKREEAGVFAGLAETLDEVERVFANVKPPCHDLRLGVFGTEPAEDAVAKLSKTGLSWTYRW